ncbi:cyclic nucleotide-binding domain-containing protein [Rhodovibrionaceae bacterium A322]
MTDGKAIIRMAETEEERQENYRLRYRVFVDELGQNVDETTHSLSQMIEPEDEGAVLFYIESGGQVVATLRTCHGDQAVQGAGWAQMYRWDKLTADVPLSRVTVSNRLAVDPAWRHSPVLGQLVARAFQYMRDTGVWVDYLHCAPSLIALYEQLGYRRYADGFVNPAAGYRIPMLLLTEDLEHLRAVRSPLVRVARNYDSDPTARHWFNGSFPEHEAFINRRALKGEDFWNLLGDKLSSPPNQAVPLFDGLTEDQVQILLKSGAVMSYSAGQTLIRPGDYGEEMFVILSGLAEVFAQAKDRKVSVAVFGTGDLFGEMGLIGARERSAEVVAQSDLELLVLTRDVLQRALKSRPEIIAPVLYNLSLLLCERLRVSTQSWMEALDGDDEG